MPAVACAIPREKDGLNVISTVELAEKVSVFTEMRALSVLGGAPIMFRFVVMILCPALALPEITRKSH